MRKTVSDAENFTFSGTGRCTLSLIVAQKLRDGVKRELRYVIAYDGDSQPKVGVMLSFSNDKEAGLYSSFILQKGEHEYTFKPAHYKRGGYSLDFVNLNGVAFTVPAEKIGAGTFSLRRVYVREGEQKKAAVTKLERTRGNCGRYSSGTRETFLQVRFHNLSGSWDETPGFAALLRRRRPENQVRDTP